MGCAIKATATSTDSGAMPAVDPYDHRKNPQYTKGEMAGFRALYVDPATYPASLVPVTPPKAPPIQTEGPALPDGLFPAILIQADLSKLDEGHTFTDLVSAISNSREGVVVQMPSTGLVFFPAPSSEKLRARTLRRLKSTRVGNSTVAAVASMSVLETIPTSAATSMVKSSPDGEVRFEITLVPRPVAPATPATGSLLIENTATAWAEVQINEAKVGTVGPLAHGTIANVKAGTYKVTFTLPNGYSWSEDRMTTPEK